VGLEDVRGHGEQVVQRVLHLRVLERVELERAQRGVQGDEEVATRVPQRSLGRLLGLRGRGCDGVTGHGVM
jgi:hypothetical protein